MQFWSAIESETMSGKIDGDIIVESVIIGVLSLRASCARRQRASRSHHRRIAESSVKEYRP